MWESATALTGSAPLGSCNAFGLRAVECDFERVELLGVDDPGESTAGAASRCARLRLLNQAQVCAGTHTMASEFSGGHDEDALFADDDFEVRRGGGAHRPSVVLRARRWSDPGDRLRLTSRSY